jgi:soluble lytic murein transglycosylase-like protein
MTTQTKSMRGARQASRAAHDEPKSARKRKDASMQSDIERRAARIRALPGIVLLAVVVIVLLPQMLSMTLGAAGRAVSSIPNMMSRVSGNFAPSAVAPLFTPQVDYWSEEIRRWATQYNLDPNLLATVMQIESCGHDTVGSSAGAQGLFQVMPFHFQTGENMLDPDTNAMRGANFLNECLGYANGDPGLAMACYNGGPSVINRSFGNWAAETQRYYTWGTAIYLDAQQNKAVSQPLNDWLNAGGQSLCTRASDRLGL